MRRGLVVLAACHAPVATPAFVAPMEYTTPTPVEAAPVAPGAVTGPPPEPTTALVVDGPAMQPEPGDDADDVRAPWESIRAGYLDNHWILELGLAGHRYALDLADHRRASLDALSYHDVVRGGDPELVVEYDVMGNDFHERALVVCGIGASQLPTCTAPIALDRLSGDASSTVAITYPSTGGLVIAATGAAPRRLRFAFP